MRGLLWSSSSMALVLCAACTADTFGGGDAGPTDAGNDATSDGGATGCGACSAPNLCCVYTGSGTSYTCAPTCAAPVQGQDLSALACTSSADCSQGVCCVSRVNNVNQSACMAQCTSSQAQLCDPSSPNPGCPAGAPCSSQNITDWKLPPTFGTCGGVSVP